MSIVSLFCEIDDFIS